MTDYNRKPTFPNIDNMCIIRGRPTKDDFTDCYKIKDDETTILNLELKVRNRALHTFDYVIVQVYGHVPNEAIPYYEEGGMAEQLLRKLSSKCDITLYCHASYRHYLNKRGKESKIQLLICDSFRTESRTSRMQAIQEDVDRKKALEQKYINVPKEQKEGE